MIQMARKGIAKPIFGMKYFTKLVDNAVSEW